MLALLPCGVIFLITLILLVIGCRKGWSFRVMEEIFIIFILSAAAVMSVSANLILEWIG